MDGVVEADGAGTAVDAAAGVTGAGAVDALGVGVAGEGALLLLAHATMRITASDRPKTRR